MTNDPRASIAKNKLLATLPEDACQRILPHLQEVSLALGEVLYESGGPQEFVYFPTTAIVSLLYTMENGQSAEMAVTGYEGVVGIALFMGGGSMPSRAVIQSGGQALRMKARTMQAEFDRGNSFHKALLRYTMALITQMSQTAVCNRLHSLDQQLCRWLLLSHDRLRTNELVMTHELISNMLGVRREGVTLAAGHLQKAGLISYRRGRISILDRAGLEARVCECYKVIKNESDRLLGVSEREPQMTHLSADD
jgi:CRP-like cAMP-binding protein